MIAAAQPTTIPPIAPPERPEELEELELEFELGLVGWEVVVVRVLVLVAVWWFFVPAVAG